MYTLISQGVYPLWGFKQVRGVEKSYFRLNIIRQMALTADASRHFSCLDIGL